MGSTRRDLLAEVHPQLQDAIGALRVRHQMEGINFTERANHLSANVSELPDHQPSKKVSAVDKTNEPQRIRGGGRPGSDPASKRNGIHMPDGTVWTGYYSNWEKMSESDKNTVMETRKKKKGTTPTKKRSANDLKAQLAKLKRSIAAMQSTPFIDKDDSDSSDTNDNAGDDFGGRSK